MSELAIAGGVAVLLVAVGWLATRRRRAAVDHRPLMPADLGPFPVTVFFSSGTCASCPPARHALAEAIGEVFREYSWDVHPGVLRRLRIERVPTTWVVDADGRVVEVAEGEPTKALVEAARREAPGRNPS